MPEKRTVAVGIIGLGARAETLLASIFLIPEIRISSVCDVRTERIEKILSIFDAHAAPRPKTYTDYHDLVRDRETEAVLVPTSWNSHLTSKRLVSRIF